MRVHERVKMYLEENRITQKELAKKCGMSEVTISLILRGGRKFECDEFEKIILALNVSADTFMKCSKKAS